MRIILCLSIICLFFCCSTQKEIQPNTKVIIVGKVLNPALDLFKINFSINRIGFGQERITSVLDNNGNFKVSFESSIPTDIFLSNLNFLILTYPGDSIYLEFDGGKGEITEKQKSIKFSGDHSILNNEAAAFQYVYYASGIYTDWERKEYALKKFDELQYRLFADSVRKEQINILNSFITERTPSVEVKRWAQTFLDADYYKNLLGYPIKHRMANKLDINNWNVPITYFDFINNQFSIDNFSLLSGYAITSFVNNYSVFVGEKVRNDNKLFFSSNDTIKRHPEKLDSLLFFGTIKYTNDPLLRQMALTELLSQGLEQSDIRMFEKYEEKIKHLIIQPYLKVPLINLYHKTLESLDKPELASSSILNKLNGSSIKSDVDRIISSNRGKVIYLDCWATWCGPCIAEMPNSKLLMDEYKTKNVAFVFICLDSDEKSWKAVINKNSLMGQHFFLNKDQSSDFRKVFRINGIPHYILFNKKGDISENMTLPPSAVKDKIDKLLIE